MTLYSPAVLVRFHDKVDRREPAECWPWTAAKNPDGYGQLFAGRRGRPPLRAHVVAYEIEHGAVPPGLHVLHRCDHPPCCNPAHLYAGTNYQNILDKMERRRHARVGLRGSRNPNAAITENIVLEIRRMLAVDDSRVTSKIILARYGITKSMLYTIRHGKAWRHVGAPPFSD